MAITKVSASLVDLDGGVVINESSADADFRVESNGNANMLFVDGGNDRVGIGTSSPSKELDVVGTIKATGADNSNTMEVFGGTTTNQSFGLLVDAGTSASDYAARFRKSDNTVIMEVSGDGNVGIGETSPANNLHIGIDNGGEGILVKSTGDHSAMLQFNVNRSSGNRALAQLNGLWNGTSVADIQLKTGNDTTNKDDGEITFHTSSANNIAERMRIDSSGNVSIGNTSTSFKLEVTGSVKLGGTGAIETATNALKASATGDNGFLIRSAVSSAANPSYSSVDDTNTGMFLPGSDVIGLTTGGTERMRIDSSGNVQIGTGTPAYLVGTSDIAQLSVNRVGTSGVITNASRSAAYINVNGASGGSSIEFNTAGANNTQPSERMRIDGDGNVLIAGTSFSAIDGATQKGIAFRAIAGRQINCLDSGANAFEFSTVGNGNAGEITCTGTSTNYSTSSDYRLKNIKGNVENALERTLKLNPVVFEWKADKRISEGFIAHEVQEIFADAVSGKKDDEKMQSMDYGRITPLLVKAIQELSAEVEELKTKLENK